MDTKKIVVIIAGIAVLLSIVLDKLNTSFNRGSWSGVLPGTSQRPPWR